MNTNNYLETDIKTGISKSDISDHFPVFLISKTTRADKYSAETFMKRENINSEALQEFKQILSLVNQGSVAKLQDVNAASNRFLELFSRLYDIAFSEQKIKIKNKALNSLWIIKGLQRSSKKTPKITRKVSEKRNKTSEKRIKTYKTFKTLKKKSKKPYYSNLIDKHKHNIKI